MVQETAEARPGVQTGSRIEREVKNPNSQEYERSEMGGDERASSMVRMRTLPRQNSRGVSSPVRSSHASSSSPPPGGRGTSHGGPTPDVRMFKRSQRPTWSCTECARRKIKCDKRIPCQPCIKRGTEKHCSLDHGSAFVANGSSGSPSTAAGIPATADMPNNTAGGSMYSSGQHVSPVSEQHPHAPGFSSTQSPVSVAQIAIQEDVLNLVKQLKDTVTDMSTRLQAVERSTKLSQTPPSLARPASASLHSAAFSRPALANSWSHALERQNPQHFSSSSSSSSPDRLHTSTVAVNAVRGSPRSEKQEHGGGDADAALTFEYLALGRDRKRGMAQQRKKSIDESHSSPPLPTTKNILAQPSSQVIPDCATRMLITDKALDFVMTYAKDAVAWQHACVHSQTFSRELEAFQSLQAHERWIWTDPLWLALFFTIQCVAVHQMPPGDVNSIFGEVSTDAPALLLDAALVCLETGRYLSEPSLYTCQALAILCVTGHNVADSNLLSSHLAIGIKTAQMLNLHRLGRQAVSMSEYLESKGGIVTDTSPKWREEIISLEMGKRIWWSLVQQDYFAMPFCGTSMVNPRQHDTPMPVNVHDHELDAGTLRLHYDDADLTLVQKLRLTSKSAQIVYTFFEQLPQRQPASLEEHVSPYEAELIALLPQTQPRSSNPRLKFGLALRRYINVSVSHKVLVLHRGFCSIPLLSQNAHYTPTPAAQLQLSHNRVLDAARQILDQVRGINPSGRPEGQVGSMWTISYQAVAAAVVVALTFFRTSTDPTALPGCHIARSEISDARAVLESLALRSAIAQRGMHLLDNLMRSFDDAIHQTETENQRNSRNYDSDHPGLYHDQQQHASAKQALDDGSLPDVAAKRGIKRSFVPLGSTASVRSSSDARKRARGEGKSAQNDDVMHDFPSTSADTVLAQLDVDEANDMPSFSAAPSLSTVVGPASSHPAFDFDWNGNISNMLGAFPDVSKLFDGSMGNLFG